jgi:hypothetical protein
MTTPRHDFRPAILRAIGQKGKTKAELVAYLGAQDRWNAVDYDLRRLRIDGKVQYVKGEWRRVR